uniref:SFRICE_006329 n=1 Tax=Spodoptera frugiperda TaxID=7108 RepID=A0A2H1V7N2_SPOFR
MYKSDTAHGLEDALKGMTANKSVKAPLPGVYSKCNPVRNELPPLLPPYVSPEWRRDSVYWDNKQLRTYADPTKHFWLTREPPKYVILHSVQRNGFASTIEQKIRVTST